MPLTPALWERIVEIETGLPKPPAGHLTVCDLHTDDRRTSFVAYSAPSGNSSIRVCERSNLNQRMAKAWSRPAVYSATLPPAPRNAALVVPT